MHQQNVFVLCRFGCDEIFRRGQLTFQQPLMDQPVLLRWKNMCADRQLIVVAIDEFKRKRHFGLDKVNARAAVAAKPPNI
jgi:hypothetical protein